MGVFDDKKFERLDWMTQITETIDSELSDILAELPDRVEYDAAKLAQNIHSHSYVSFSFSSDYVVPHLISDLPQYRALTWAEQSAIARCFKFEISPDLEFNLETKAMSGTMALVKIVHAFEDDELQRLMGAKGLAGFRSRVIFNDEWPIERFNEILDILGSCDEDKKNRSQNKKTRRIEARLREIFSTNEWRIRDMTLADKVCDWAADYILSGNLAALTNLCKLKVMTHHNMPIYSVEEEK